MYVNTYKHESLESCAWKPQKFLVAKVNRGGLNHSVIAADSFRDFFWLARYQEETEEVELGSYPKSKQEKTF